MGNHVASPQRNHRPEEDEVPEQSLRPSCAAVKKTCSSERFNNNNNKDGNNMRASGAGRGDYDHAEPSSLPLQPLSRPVLLPQRQSFLQEGLLREHDAKYYEFDRIYDVLHRIGHGGMCTIYKIQKKQEWIGGSSRPGHVRQSSCRKLRKGILRRFHSGGSSTSSLTSSSTSTSSSCSTLQQCPCTAPMYFALKVINLDLVKEDKIDQLRNEVEILKALDHKNIINAYETFHNTKDSKHTSIQIVMELCTGGDLSSRLPYTEHVAANVTKQILSAVSYMHELNIVHRDLKLENIMFESCHADAAIKVIDFGLSKAYDCSEMVLTERVGTLYSMSPETLKGEYTTQADLWSIGVCTYMLLANGEKPFRGGTPKQLVANILSGTYAFETTTIADERGVQTNTWDGISEDAKSFVRALLVVDPTHRPSAPEAIHHSWIQNHKDLTMSSSSGTSTTIAEEEEDDDGNREDGDEDARDDKDQQHYQHNGLVVSASSSSSCARGDRGRRFVVDEDLKQRVRESILQYADSGDFRKLALNVIAKRSTCEEVFELRRVFDVFDTLDTGTITLEEFRDVLEQYHFSDEELYEIFRKVDINHTNVINYTEFLAAALETQASGGTIEEYRLAEAFDLMDCDDSGTISRENLRHILGGGGGRNGVYDATIEEYIDRLIAEVDPHGRRGSITYQDFLSVFQRSTSDDEEEEQENANDNANNNKRIVVDDDNKNHRCQKDDSSSDAAKTKNNEKSTSTAKTASWHSPAPTTRGRKVISLPW